MSRIIKFAVLFSFVFPLSALAEEATTEPAEAAENTATEAPTAEASESTTSEAPAAEPEVVQTGTVSRAQFTSAIANREPTDRLANTAAGGKVFFFTELRDFAGQTVTHRWVFNNETKADVSFNVKGNRWRVNSSKNIREDWDGTWQVHVIDGNGTQVGSYALDVTAPPVATEETETESESTEEPEAEAEAETASESD